MEEFGFNKKMISYIFDGTFQIDFHLLSISTGASFIVSIFVPIEFSTKTVSNKPVDGL